MISFDISEEQKFKTKLICLFGGFFFFFCFYYSSYYFSRSSFYFFRFSSSYFFSVLIVKSCIQKFECCTKNILLKPNNAYVTPKVVAKVRIFCLTLSPGIVDMHNTQKFKSFF